VKNFHKIYCDVGYLSLQLADAGVTIPTSAGNGLYAAFEWPRFRRWPTFRRPPQLVHYAKRLHFT